MNFIENSYRTSFNSPRVEDQPLISPEQSDEIRATADCPPEERFIEVFKIFHPDVDTKIVEYHSKNPLYNPYLLAEALTDDPAMRTRVNSKLQALSRKKSDVSAMEHLWILEAKATSKQSIRQRY